MAAESLVLLPQDTTSLNYGGLKQTQGLGKINHEGSLGFAPALDAGVEPRGGSLGCCDAQCWGREGINQEEPAVGRNGKSLDQKESARWVRA